MSTSGSGGPPQDKPATHSTESQTDLTEEEIEYLITELEECRKKAKILEEKLENKKRLKRELIIEDVLRNGESEILHGFAKPCLFQFYLESNSTIYRKD